MGAGGDIRKATLYLTTSVALAGFLSHLDPVSWFQWSVRIPSCTLRVAASRQHGEVECPDGQRGTSKAVTAILGAECWLGGLPLWDATL